MFLPFLYTFQLFFHLQVNALSGVLDNFDDEELDTIRIFADTLEKVRQNQKKKEEIFKKDLQAKTNQLEEQKKIEDSLAAELEEVKIERNKKCDELEEQKRKEQILKKDFEGKNAELEERRKKEESLTMQLEKKILRIRKCHKRKR